MRGCTGAVGDTLEGEMSAILYVAAFVAVAVIIFWYILDESTRGGKAHSGLLGMSDGARRTRRGAPEPQRPWRQSRG